MDVGATRWDDAEWLEWLNDGQRLVLVSGLESFTIDQAFQSLFRPDIVAAKLKGDGGDAVADNGQRHVVSHLVHRLRTAVSTDQL